MTEWCIFAVGVGVGFAVCAVLQALIAKAIEHDDEG